MERERATFGERAGELIADDRGRLPLHVVDPLVDQQVVEPAQNYLTQAPAVSRCLGAAAWQRVPPPRRLVINRAQGTFTGTGTSRTWAKTRGTASTPQGHLSSSPCQPTPDRTLRLDHRRIGSAQRNRCCDHPLAPPEYSQCMLALVSRGQAETVQDLAALSTPRPPIPWCQLFGQLVPLPDSPGLGPLTSNLRRAAVGAILGCGSDRPTV